jgi:hypothetical protein
MDPDDFGNLPPSLLLLPTETTRKSTQGLKGFIGKMPSVDFLHDAS